MGIARFSERSDPGYQSLSAELKTLVSGLHEIALPESSDTPIHRRSQVDTTHFVLPFRRNENFQGRKDIIQQVEKQLSSQNAVAISGLGGSGFVYLPPSTQPVLIRHRKSHVALEICYRLKEKRPDSHIFWIFARSGTNFLESYLHLARTLRIPGYDNSKSDVLQLVHHWLMQSTRDWLLVLDNIDDLDEFCNLNRAYLQYEAMEAKPLLDFIPRNSNTGRILLTTCDRRVGMIFTNEEPIIVPSLPPDEALDLCKSELKGCIWNQMAAKAVIAELEHLPLAIVQAAAFISNNSMSIPEYHAMLTQSDGDRMDLLSAEQRDFRRDSKETLYSVQRTFSLSFDHLQKSEPEAARLLKTISFFDRQSIPHKLIAATGDRQASVMQALGTLRAFTFLEYQDNSRSYAIHRLVKLIVRRLMEIRNEEAIFASQALSTLVLVYPSGEIESWEECEAFYPHGVAMEAFNFREHEDLRSLAGLRSAMARYDFHRGRWNSAELRARMAYESLVFLEGESNPSTLVALHILTKVTLDLGRRIEAEELAAKVLNLRTQLLGSKHPATLESHSLLADVCNHLGKYSQAESLLREGIRNRIEVYGHDDPFTIRDQAWLARVVQHLGRYDEAAEIVEDALQRSQNKFGHFHIQTLECVKTYSIILRRKGCYEEALSMSQRAYDSCRGLLGPNHPSTLNNLNRLAIVNSYLGKLEIAEHQYREAFAGYGDGAERHLSALHILDGLGDILRQQEKYDEAIETFNKMLKVRQEKLPSGHPDILQTKSTLASTPGGRAKQKSLPAKLSRLGSRHSVQNTHPRSQAWMCSR
jgi:tetratricopeptide (TPR) repeat protein